jgi:hypothetical protein
MGLLETLILVCLVLWILGLGTGYALGGAIHVLLAVVIVLVLVKVLRGERL